MVEVNIVVIKWSVVEKNKQKTIGGTYEVRCGTAVLSTSNFNDSYSSTEVSIPATLMTEVEAIDAKVRQAIVDNFTK